MSMHDAQPGDVYVDAQGKLWRVFSYCSQPTVGVEEIEKNGDYADDQRVRMNGGVSGLMWDGFKRICRKEEPKS